jgi:small-conductance mechanosensitive channel
MNEIIRALQEISGLETDLLIKMAKSIGVILILWALNKIILKLVFRQVEDVFYRYRWRKYQNSIVFLVGIIIVSQIWIKEFQSVATFLGLLTAGIAIALREPVVDLAGWLFIIWRRPFEVGDRIEISKNSGDVIDIRIFQFTIIETGNWVEADQSTGRLIHIPNSKVFRESLANYSTGFNYIWHEIGILITFESNWEKAKALLEDVLLRNSEKITPAVEKRIKDASKKYMIYYKNLTPIVYTSVKDSGVKFTMRFLCDPRQRRSYEEKIWEETLRVFAKENDIDFAYPTQRFYQYPGSDDGGDRTKG